MLKEYEMFINKRILTAFCMLAQVSPYLQKKFRWTWMKALTVVLSFV